MTKRYRGNPAQFDSNVKKDSLPYLDKIKKDSLVSFDDTSYPHTRLGRKKLKNPEFCKKYDSTIADFSTKTWQTLLNDGKVNGIEPIPVKQITVEFPTSFPKEKLTKKVGVGRYSNTHRFGGIFDVAECKFFVFWVDQSQDDFYKHIAG